MLLEATIGKGSLSLFLSHTLTQCNADYNVLLAKYKDRAQIRHENGPPLVLHCPIMVLKVLSPYQAPSIDSLKEQEVWLLCF